MGDSGEKKKGTSCDFPENTIRHEKILIDFGPPD